MLDFYKTDPMADLQVFRRISSMAKLERPVSGLTCLLNVWLAQALGVLEAGCTLVQGLS